IRATDAKEVGVKNPAEETCCYPNHIREKFMTPIPLCQYYHRARISFWDQSTEFILQCGRSMLALYTGRPTITVAKKPTAALGFAVRFAVCHRTGHDRIQS